MDRPHQYRSIGYDLKRYWGSFNFWGLIIFWPRSITWEIREVSFAGWAFPGVGPQTDHRSHAACCGNEGLGSVGSLDRAKRPCSPQDCGSGLRHEGRQDHYRRDHQSTPLRRAGEVRVSGWNNHIGLAEHSKNLLWLWINVDHCFDASGNVSVQGFSGQERKAGITI